MLETIDGDCLILRSHHCSADFLRKMTKLREESLYVDVRLQVFEDENVCRQNEEPDIIAHKLVLSCCSPYFEAMFSKKFAENGFAFLIILIEGQFYRQKIGNRAETFFTFFTYETKSLEKLECMHV
jgi:hypothetical protein